MANSREYQKQWRANNKSKVAEYNRRRRSLRAAYKRRRRLENPKESGEQLRRWFAKHPGKRNEYRAAYNARKKNLAVLLSDEEKKQVAAFYLVARMMTKNTGTRHHVDHIQPLAKGGLHHPANLQVLTATQNQRKNTK